jgi:carbamoyltransferase
MKILGINEGFHDAAVTLIEDGEIKFAGHAERYSKKKNDWSLRTELVVDALNYSSNGYSRPDLVTFYEKPWLKKLRLKLLGGQPGLWPMFQGWQIGLVDRKNISHHRSHAAAGYYTSPFDDALVVVLDAMGEFETSTMWLGEGTNLKKVKSVHYPRSFGLFYSAFTDLVGLKANEEEYILMGMAAYGDYWKYYDKVNSYFPKVAKQKYNFHKGITDWDLPITEEDRFDIAAAVQQVYQDRLWELMWDARKRYGKKNLVFMGGCALNCSANTMLWDIFDDIWIMPNPGDAGSSLGSAAAVYGKHLNWTGPYLGYDLGNEYPVKQIVKALKKDKIVAVASGRAEFGPRSLGNRSILADPRDPAIKDKVNLIKKRELFRPFAPVVMEEHAAEWFDMDFTSPYMQYAVTCLKPDLIPAVVHVDGTSRVQTVNKEQHPGLYEVLRQFYERTGVPVLLNTSLNIKGQPIINDEADIVAWEATYGYTIAK